MNQSIQLQTESAVSQLALASERPVTEHAVSEQGKKGVPLSLQVLAGFVIGGALGVAFGADPILLNVSTVDLGSLGMLVIRLLKALAIPLVLFAILQAIIKTPISGRQGRKLILICGVNMTVAMVIGLTIMNTLEPGRLMQDAMSTLTASAQGNAAHAPVEPPKATLSPLKNLSGYIPENVLQPFLTNNIISVILVALLGGFALRRVKESADKGAATGMNAVEGFITVVYECLVQMLGWVVRLVPFAVAGLVAQSVGRSGLQVFSSLGIFVVVLVGGLLLHGGVYYPLVAWFKTGKSPKKLFSQGADALLMGVSTNSSLATVPTTLRCLTQNMGVSAQSANLSACIGTNLNNDGVTLYEAMTVLFLAQACGIDLSLGAQLAVIAAAIMAGVGVAGIPEAGLIVLPLVLSAAGLPDWLVAAAIPLILPVDWFVARARSFVNVMSDMLVALLLDTNKTPLR